MATKTRIYKVLLLVAFQFLFADRGSAQQYVGEKADQRVKNAKKVIYNKDRQSIDFVVFNSPPTVDSKALSQWLKNDILKLNSNNNFELYKTETDKLNFIHYRYKQTYKGIIVEDGVYYVHTKNGSVQTINGEFYGGIQISTNASLSKLQAFDKAIAYVNAKKYYWENGNYNGKQEILDASQLVIVSVKTEFKLAYKIDIYAIEPLSRQYVFIDANTGEVVKTKNRMHAIDAAGTAHTAYNGIQTITTDKVSNSEYRLKDNGRNIETWNELQNEIFLDSDNTWDNINPDKDQYATDAHWGAEIFYDYFKNTFGRNSLDGNGNLIKSKVHGSIFGGASMANAFWFGGEVIYGDGGVHYTPFTSLDIVCHELTHGLTEYSAGLVYENESGALNESFSDIFGNSLRFKFSPNVATWLVGDQLVPIGSIKSPLRNMANPNQFFCADTYGGTYFNFGDKVHYDSGIQNFWFYLLCEGGSGINDKYQKYKVEKISMDDALAIAYRNLTVYLTPTATFNDAYIYSEQAAEDLFGNCSYQKKQVGEAWYAVGVNNTSATVFADFTISNGYSCTYPLIGNFVNISTNGQSYTWDYGDGTTGTTSFHFYTLPGIYNVKLVAKGNSSCGNTIDSITKIGAVVIGNKQPIAKLIFDSLPAINQGLFFVDSSLYKDYTAKASLDFGDGSPIISNTFFNVQYHTYDAGTYTLKYIVENCFSTDTLVRKIVVDSYRLTVNANSEDSIGTLYDSGGKNGKFKDGEKGTFLINPPCADTLYLDVNIDKINYSLTNNQIELNIYDGSTVNSPIIASIKNGDFIGKFKAKSGVALIQFKPEYYTQADSGFTIKWGSKKSSKKVIPDFIFNFQTNPTNNYEYSFFDLSTGGASYFQWYFGDGSTSNVQNANHTYAFPGTYQVKLITSNCIGIDSIVKTLVINPEIKMCSSASYSDNKSGILTDSGGQDNNYSNNEDCVFYIKPASCSTFLEMNIEHDLGQGDTLFVYRNNTFYSTPRWVSAGMYTLKNTYEIQQYSFSKLDTFKIHFKSDITSNSSGYKIKWNYTTPGYSPAAGTISYTQDLSNPLKYSFFHSSSIYNNATNVFWNFGDGNIEQQLPGYISANHVYANYGVYKVKAIVENCVGIDSTEIILNATPLGISIINNTDTKYIAYPNPANNIITVKGLENSKFQLRVINSIGQIMQNSEHLGTAENIDLLAFPSGLYFFLISDSSQITNLKVQVNH